MTKKTIWASARGVALALVAAYGALALPSCTGKQTQEARVMTGGGDPQRGPAAIRSYGCGSCHQIPGVAGAAARVGPPLDELIQRASLAGQLPNTGENLVRWIEHPQRHRPGTLMPEMNVSEGDARDIAAYLYSVR
jgi:cytochrome c2